jgi:hypothetical protein
VSGGAVITDGDGKILCATADGRYLPLNASTKE